MFCAGSKITFKDGRIAAARNANELEKVFNMTTDFSAVNCFADSIGLEAALTDNSGVFLWSNRDTGEKYTVTANTLDDIKKISIEFMKTGERCPGYNWSKQ